MSELKNALREAFESEGYDVADVSINRDQVRVAIVDSGASGDALRSITHDVVDESDTLGLAVSTEAGDGQDGMTTVVSFRYRG